MLNAMLRSVSLSRLQVRIVSIAAVIVVLSALLPVPPASAWHTTFPWSGGPGPGVCCAYIHYTKASGMNSYDDSAWNYAVSKWNASAALIILQNQGPTGLTLNEVFDCFVSWDGLTPMTYYGGYIKTAKAQLNACFTNTMSHTTLQTQGVATHELGHAIGLEHEDARGCVIMQSATTQRSSGSCYIDTPQGDDTTGANTLY